MKSDLFAVYSGLASTFRPSQEIAAANLIPGRLNDYITVGRDGNPLLLLSSSDINSLRPSMVLQYMQVDYSVKYRIKTEEKDIEEFFVAISLRDSDGGLMEPFFVAGEVITASLPNSPSSKDIDGAIRSLIELLSALTVPPTRAIAGLWTELWLILNSENIESALQAWHNETSEHFDFAFSDHFVEVKATEQPERTHNFSLDQVRNAGIISIVSVKLQRSAEGPSLNDLVDGISAQVNLSARSKLVRSVFAAIGKNVVNADEIRFNPDFAEQHLRVIRAEHVPAPQVSSGSPIYSVKFRANLDDSSVAKNLVEREISQALSTKP